MKPRRTVLVIGLVGGGLVAGFGLKSVLADGIPATNPLYYAGTLTEGGTPVNGPRDITVNLWSAQTGGTMLCQTLATGQTMANVTNGRFRIALDPSCKTAINQNSGTWVEVIDSATSLGRAPIGAVPYAVEADRASGAAGALATQVVPTGAVMFFNLSSCPSGWSDLPAAQGRYVVGLDTGGTLAATVGSPLSDMENRAVGQHGHSISDPGHNHGGATGGVANWTGNTDPTFDFTSTGAACTRALMYGNPDGCYNSFSAHNHSIASSVTGVTVANAGAVAGTNAPYVEFRICQKN
jgi:hypothetical protein